MKITLPLLAFLILLSGCASKIGKPIDVSNGASDKATIFTEIHSKSRFLKPSEYDLVEIVDVDGKKFDNTSYLTETQSHPFYLKPGEHKLKVRVLLAGPAGLVGTAGEDTAANQTIGELSVNLAQNKTYLISAKATEFITILFRKRPKKYEYSISEYSGSEPPVVAVDY